MQLPQEKADKGKAVLSFKLAPDVKTDLASSDLRRIEGIEGPVNWDVVAP